MITQLVVCWTIIISKINMSIKTINYYKNQALDAYLKAIQQINVAGNLNRAAGATMFFIIEEAKETVLDFSQRTVKVF